MVVMLCTRSRGGMRSVVEAYRRAGLFERRQVHLLYTHDEGPLVYRLALALWSLLCFALMLIRGQVTLVHAHISMRGSFWRKIVFANLAQLFGVPVVGHLHGSDFDHFVVSQPKWVQRIVTGQLERMATVLVLGECWRHFVLSVAPAARVVVLPNYVRMPSGIARHAKRETVELLFLGIVGRRKGVYDLLEAFAAARAKYPSLQLTIAGNGEIDQARSAATTTGIADSVRFTGWLDDEEKNVLLKNSDICVLPSYNEGLPISILEAMSWGLPIITTDVGAIAQLVRHEIDGLIVPAGAPDSLAHAILRLASSQVLRIRMGYSGRRRVGDAFSEEVVLPRLERIYDDVHTGSRARTDEGIEK